MSDESDVTIAEIRQVRHAISARLGHDPQQVIAYYIELQRQYAGRCLPTEGEELPITGRSHPEFDFSPD